MWEFGAEPVLPPHAAVLWQHHPSTLPAKQGHTKSLVLLGRELGQVWGSGEPELPDLQPDIPRLRAVCHPLAFTGHFHILTAALDSSVIIQILWLWFGLFGLKLLLILITN